MLGGQSQETSLLHRLLGPPTPSLLLSIYPLLITCNAELTTNIQQKVFAVPVPV